jgi:RES domain-containing protein
LRWVALSRWSLPAEWRVEPPPPSTKAVRDAWVRGKRSAVLALPSVIIPGDLNYLLNPAHPAFKRIAIGKPERFAFDPRLLTWRCDRVGAWATAFRI